VPLLVQGFRVAQRLAPQRSSAQRLVSPLVVAPHPARSRSLVQRLGRRFVVAPRRVLSHTPGPPSGAPSNRAQQQGRSSSRVSLPVRNLYAVQRLARSRSLVRHSAQQFDEVSP
jgi:hypothetical protein